MVLISLNLHVSKRLKCPDAKSLKYTTRKTHDSALSLAVDLDSLIAAPE